MSDDDHAPQPAEPAPRGPSRRRRLIDVLIILMIPLVLSGVALHQVHLGTTSGLTPWKGGGFGMFSSPDRASHRAVRGSFEGEFGQVPVDMYSLQRRTDAVDRKTFVNANALPDARRMEPLADLVRAAEWRIRSDEVAVFAGWRDEAAGDTLVVWLDDDGDREQVRVDRFTIEVWGPRYSIDDKRIEPYLISTHHYDVVAEAPAEARP